jgi:hypothetical protein
MNATKLSKTIIATLLVFGTAAVSASAQGPPTPRGPAAQVRRSIDAAERHFATASNDIEAANDEAQSPIPSTSPSYRIIQTFITNAKTEIEKGKAQLDTAVKDLRKIQPRFRFVPFMHALIEGWIMQIEANKKKWCDVADEIGEVKPAIDDLKADGEAAEARANEEAKKDR